MQLGLHRVGGAEHVAVDVAGGRDRVDAAGVDNLMHVLNVRLEHAVELEGLARGQAHRAVAGVLFSELLDHQPLFRRDDAARHTRTQHDIMQRLELLLGALGADVAVVLLIHAVEADQLEVVGRKATGDAVLEIGLDGATQEIALLLQALVVGEFALDNQFRRISVLLRQRAGGHGCTSVQLRRRPERLTLTVRSVAIRCVVVATALLVRL